MPIQGYLIILLPVLTPLIGSSLAAVLAQDNWPAWLNDGIAWFVLLACAGLDLWASNLLTGGFSAILNAAVAIVTLLASGALVSLKPWLAWLSWLQSNIFDLVPLLNGTTSKPAPANANPVRVPTALVVPPSASEPPKQA
jgi:hypothetical protein